jgi:hypothetical protein
MCYLNGILTTFFEVTIMTDQYSGPVPADVIASEDKLRPRTWWQWVVLFPTLAMALITAMPDWINTVHGLWKDPLLPDYEAAVE